MTDDHYVTGPVPYTLVCTRCGALVEKIDGAAHHDWFHDWLVQTRINADRGGARYG